MAVGAICGGSLLSGLASMDVARSFLSSSPSIFLTPQPAIRPLASNNGDRLPRKSANSSSVRKAIGEKKMYKQGFLSVRASSETSDTPLVTVEDNVDEVLQTGAVEGIPNEREGSDGASVISNDLKKVMNKTAATFAPRASTARKNPAVPGSTLYTIFEVQAYASMVVGGVLSFNLLFPSNEPDIWRLMGMWSIWMFTIPSLRARDCSNQEKEALNYLFVLVPLLNVLIPFFWKSFAVVWSADTVVFFLMYAWKMKWLQEVE